MRIKLTTDWFAPNGQYYRKGEPIDVPNEFKDVLPKGTEILGMTEVNIEKPKPKPKPKAKKDNEKSRAEEAVQKLLGDKK